MEAFRIAHIRIQGVDLVIVLVDKSFAAKPSPDQDDIVGWLQECAVSAGLAGRVVPVWDAGGNRMGFRAIRDHHPFFGSIDLRWVARNINKELRCS